MLRLEWGIEGLRSAIARNDNVVIIDQIRFSSTVVTAVALGFIIEPTSDKTRRTNSFSLSPSSFLNKMPSRVVVSSSNGAYLSTCAKDAKNVTYGSILNARAIGTWIDTENIDTTLLAAGEVDVKERRQFLNDDEKKLSKENDIFALEDFITAGAIAYYSDVKKSAECNRAIDLFKKHKDELLDFMMNTASHRYNKARGKGKDTLDCSKLNAYNVVPALHIIEGVPEISVT